MPRSARLQQLEERLGLSTLGTGTIFAIVAVLVLVSLPRLRSFAATANEEDARSTSLRLAAALAERVLVPGELPPVEEVARDHLRELTNAEFLDDGRQMRRHGYLFSLRRVPRPESTGLGRVVYASDQEPLLAIVAWPWDVGRTGQAAWVATVEGDLLSLRTENEDVPLDGWNGPGHAPPLGQAIASWSWDGWQAVP